MDFKKYFSLLNKGTKNVRQDAGTAMGQGAEELAELARSQPPVYNKFVQQDDLGKAIPAIEPDDVITERGFTMPHPDAQVPALRTQTLPQVAGEVVDETDYSNYLPALIPGKSNKLRNGLLTAGGLGAGALGLGMLDDEQAATAAEIPVSGGQALSEEKAKEMPKKADPAGAKQFRAGDLASKLKDSYGPEGKAEEVAQPDYMAELKSAQERQGELDLIDNMLRAGTTIGSSIVRSKADYSPIDALQKQNSRGVDNVKQRMASQKDQTELNDDKSLRDPKSDVSKAFRATLAKLGIPFSEKTTAWDAKAMGINPQNLLMQDRALDKQMKMMEHKQGKERDSFVTGAQKTLLKPYQSYQKVATARASLDGYLKGEPSGPKDIAILYDFIKGLDPESAVKEGEIELGKSAMSLMEQYGIKAKKLTNSDVLSPQFRTAIADIMKSKESQARSNYEEIAQPFKLHGSSRGLTEEDYGRFDYLSAADQKKALNQNPASTATEGQTAPAAGGMVKVTRISDGASKMMTAEQAARADKSKYKVE